MFPAIHVIYLRAAISAIVPLLIILMNHAYFIIKNLLHKDKDIKEKLVLTMSVLVFFFQPQVIRFLALPINCHEFNGQLTVFENLEVTCDTEEHLNWVNLIFGFNIFLMFIT
jgi:hypothetical protein